MLNFFCCCFNYIDHYNKKLLSDENKNPFEI